MRSSLKVVFYVAVLVVMVGCAHKGATKVGTVAEAPGKTGAAGPAPTEVLSHYVVKKGDNLWEIAAKQSVLGDAFHWPLLYKQNRDQIVDPDLIEIRQDLGYRKSYGKAEIEEAQRLSKETPPYVPHSGPRKVLPVQY